MIAKIGTYGRVRCEPDWYLSEEWSRRLQDHDLWYVWAGRGSMLLGGEFKVDLVPGVLIWARPGGLYLANHDRRQPLGVNYIHFTPVGSMADVPEVHRVSELSYVDAVMRWVMDLHREGADDLALRLLGVLAGDLYEGRCTEPEPSAGGHSTTVSTHRHHQRLVHEAAAMIRESPGRPIRIDPLARKAGYTPDHFARIFRQIMGMTPKAYAVDQRLFRARALLDQTGLTVAQIADSLGYRQPALFCRQFKSRVGQTPGAYRDRR